MAILSKIATCPQGDGGRPVWFRRGPAGCCRLSNPLPGPWKAKLGILVVLAMVGSVGGMGQDQPPGEYEVKAAFLYNFAKFVEWPPGSFDGPAAPLRMCVLGSDPAFLALQQVVEGKKLNGRELHVDRLSDSEPAKNCRLLFVGVSKATEITKILRDGVGPGVLTVGEMEGFAQAGGIINLVLRQNHIAFEINVSAANRAGLRISSKLLSLATIVSADPESNKRN
jgi:YfiR/HmsC-like